MMVDEEEGKQVVSSKNHSHLRQRQWMSPCALSWVTPALTLRGYPHCAVLLDELEVYLMFTIETRMFTQSLF